MSSCNSSYMHYSSSDDKFCLTKEEDITMLVAMHKWKKSKHDSCMFGPAFIQTERVEAHKRLMCNCFATPPVFRERYFVHPFRISSDLYVHFCNFVKQHDRSF